MDSATIEAKIEARASAKRAGDFALADRIRRDLAEKGVEIKDSAQGTAYVTVAVVAPDVTL